METQKVLMLGFGYMDTVMFKPLVKDLLKTTDITGIPDMNAIRTYKGTGCVNYIVMLGCSFGLEIEKRMRELTDWYPEATFIVLSPYRLSPLIGIRFLKSGADILFWNLKNDNEYQRLRSAIETGRRYIPREVLEAIDSDLPLDGTGFMKLSKKEMEALALTIQGETLKQISHKMGIAIGTACVMRSKYMKKMGVTNVQQLVKRGLEMNIFPLSEESNAV